MTKKLIIYCLYGKIQHDNKQLNDDNNNISVFLKINSLLNQYTKSNCKQYIKANIATLLIKVVILKLFVREPPHA